MLERFVATPLMHRLVAHGDMLHVAGILASDLSQGMEGQTTEALTTIGALLTARGSGKDRILSATAYVTDLGRKEEMNCAWQAFFSPDELPTRATIGVADLGPGVLIEIVVTAAR